MMVITCLLLAGCSGSLALRSGVQQASGSTPGASVVSSSSGFQANVNSGSGPLFGVVVLGVMIADGVDYMRGTGRWARAAPPMAEDRKINIQDCTRPIEYSIGNISCR